MNKNIVVVVSAMNLGGAQRVVSILCDHWSQNGYKVTLICTYTGEKSDHYQVNKNVTLRYLSNSPLFSRSKPFNLGWKLFQLRKLIKSLDPEVVISFLTRVNVASAISTLGMKSSLIICERTWTPFASLNSTFYWLYRILFKNVDKIIVQTDKSKTWLECHFPDNEISVIPNPVVYPLPLDFERSVNPNNTLPKQRKVILASGRMHKYKQFDLLIRAFSQIKDKYPQWDLIILGDGEERLKLSQMIDALSIGNRVYLPGSVGNIADWYLRADLFILSSSVEGFPNVLLEAMVYGLPCISFDCDTGPRDMIQDGENGILVEPEEKELGLLKALDAMISNPELRNEVSNNSKLLRDKYSVVNIMKKWDEVLEI